MSEGPYREGELTPPKRVRRRLTIAGWCGLVVPAATVVGWLVHLGVAGLWNEFQALATVTSALLTIVGLAMHSRSKDPVPFMEER